MQNIIKKFIIIVLIIFVIISIVLFWLLKNMETTPENPIIDDFEKDKPKGNQIKAEDNYEFYYSVKEIIKEYYTQISNMNLDKRELSEITFLNGSETEEELNGLRNYVKKTVSYSKNNLYNQLGKEFIEEYDITQENINTKFEDLNFKELIIYEMNVTNEIEGIYTYLAKGMVVEKDKNVKDFTLMVIIDRAQNCFSIYPQNYMEKHSYINKNISDNIEILEIHNKIDKNEFNTFSLQGISKETKSNDLFEDFKTIIKYDLNRATKIIDEEYANIRFDNEQSISDYLKQKATEIRNNKLDSYLVEKKDDYTQYILIDNKGNNYILKETTPFQYVIILDNYTIPTSQFIEEYNKQTDQGKVVLNIKRFFMGIDDKNYGYSYSVLSESFKNNKYPTKNEFINYAKQNFFEKNEIEYITYEKENGVDIYKIKVKDAFGKSSDEKTLNMILRLKNGTDFEMSFGE